MPAAEIIMGTIIGDISTLMIVTRKGVYGRLNPHAPKVPKVVANIVEKNPMMKLFLIECSHWGLLRKSRYHRSENASGSNDSIPLVNVK